MRFTLQEFDHFPRERIGVWSPQEQARRHDDLPRTWLGNLCELLRALGLGWEDQCPPGLSPPRHNDQPLRELVLERIADASLPRQSGTHLLGVLASHDLTHLSQLTDPSGTQLGRWADFPGLSPWFNQLLRLMGDAGWFSEDGYTLSPSHRLGDWLSESEGLDDSSPPPRARGCGIRTGSLVWRRDTPTPTLGVVHQTRAATAHLLHPEGRASG